MFNPGFYENDDSMSGMGFFQGGMPPGRGGVPRRFDEFYRCYPVAMLPGPERDNVNHGGKVIMPPSALDRLSRLHITYPMLFELTNGASQTKTHAGVLEFIAEEGKIYLPYWMMQVLQVDPGDLVQIKSTDLPPGSFIKLQPQSPTFLDISDPKAVLENAFRNFSCLTQGDVFTFSYNDSVYEIAVLETKPSNSEKAISVLETDLEVDFAAPVGYTEPTRATTTTTAAQQGSGTSTPRSNTAAAGAGSLASKGATLYNNQGTMAAAINYASIAPPPGNSDSPLSSRTTGERKRGGDGAVNFTGAGHRLKASSRAPAAGTTPPSTTQAAAAASSPAVEVARRNTRGPQPLRLPPEKLFFGYDIKPVRLPPNGSGSDKENDEGKKKEAMFKGLGQTLRGTK